MIKKSMPVLAAMLGLILGISSANAHNDQKKDWNKNHPRRHEVNKRLNNQNKRIRQGVKSGKLTKQQAGQLHKEDRQIRQEERDMAAQNGGHITKQEQRTLNQQENQASKQIFNEKNPGQQTGGAAAPAPAPASGN